MAPSSWLIWNFYNFPCTKHQMSIKILPQIIGWFPSILLHLWRKKIAVPTNLSMLKITVKLTPPPQWGPVSQKLLAWHLYSHMPCARDTGNLPACLSLDLSAGTGFRLQEKWCGKSGVLENCSLGRLLEAHLLITIRTANKITSGLPPNMRSGESSY